MKVLLQHAFLPGTSLLCQPLCMSLCIWCLTQHLLSGKAAGTGEGVGVGVDVDVLRQRLSDRSFLSRQRAHTPRSDP